jgi:hypothetical protein
MRPVDTEPSDAQHQHREHGDIQQCVNHTSLPPKRICRLRIWSDVSNIGLRFGLETQDGPKNFQKYLESLRIEFSV